MAKKTNQPQDKKRLKDMVNPVKELPLGEGVINVSRVTLSDMMELSDIFPEFDILAPGNFITKHSGNPFEQLKIFATFLWFGARKHEPDLQTIDDCYDILNLNIFLEPDKMQELMEVIGYTLSIEMTRISDEDEPPPPEEEDTQEESTEKNE